MGDLVPVMCMETVPGDKVKIGCDQLLRFAPMIAPVMHRMNAFVHYFFVPNRLLWDGWEDWIKNPQNILPNHFPTLSMGDTFYNSLSDYLGCPLPIAGAVTEQINAFPFAAYQFVCNEFYRDQNVIDPFVYKLINGNNDAQTDLRQLRKRAWMHDYFTSALPTPQAGDPVSIPLGSQRVILDPLVDNPGIMRDPTTKDTSPAGGVNVNGVLGHVAMDAVGSPEAVYDPNNTLMTDDSGEATTITDLRRAVRLQEWLERLMRGGQRYTEMIQSMFGVRNPDARLQRPEYITGAKTPIQVSEVLNTTGEDAGLPQGNMAGHGVAVTSGKMGSYKATEHGFIIGIMSVTPMTAYQQGFERFWLKTTDPLDYFWPQFENIGEQPIYNSELYAYTGDTARETFGYIPRYAEYKYISSRVAGDFRDSLAYWHIGRTFSSLPALNQEFIECNPRQDIFAVTDPSEQKLYCHHLNKIFARRQMGKYSTPSF